MLDNYVMKLLATIFLKCCLSLALTNQEFNEIPSDKIDKIPDGEARRRDGNWQKWSFDISWGQRKTAEDRDRWKGIVATSFVVPRRPSVLRDWDEMRWVWEDLTIENLSAGVCELISRNGNSDGMVTFQDPLAWQRQFFRGQWKKQGGIRKGDRRRDGNWQKWRFDIS